MAFDFKGMQDDVLDLCQELQGQTDYTLTRIKRMINRGYHNFVKDTDCIADIFNFTTVANQTLYTSSDLANFAYCYKVFGVKYITETSEFGKILTPYRGGYYNLPRNKSYGEPTHYYTLGLSSMALRKIGTYPIIDVANETLEVQGHRYPTSELSGNTDEPQIPDEYRDALVYYAVWRLFHAYSHKNRDWRAKALEHKQLYQEMVEQYHFNNYDDSVPIHVLDYYEDYT